MYNYDVLYEKLLQCDWLSRCGDREEIYQNFRFIWAQSLSEAEEKINSVRWENIVGEEKNEIWAFLMEHHPDAFEKWNEELARIKEKYVPDIMAAVKDAVTEKNLPESFILDIECNVTMVFIFDFYSELYQCDLMNNILEIYLSGHLPCGYKGRFQKGKVIVY